MSKIRYTFEIPDGAKVAHILAAVARAKGHLIAMGTVDESGEPKARAAAEATGAPGNGDGRRKRLRGDELTEAVYGVIVAKHGTAKRPDIVAALPFLKGSGAAYHLTKLRRAKRIKAHGVRNAATWSAV